MKKITALTICLFILLGASALAASKDENRMETAEQAFKEKKYTEAKAIFNSLKDKPKFREKCYLYLSMAYYETGFIENAIDCSNKFNSYVTDKTDLTLITASDNLTLEIETNYSKLDIAIFGKDGQKGIDPGYYNMLFSSESGLNPAQKERLRIINKVISQSQGILNWLSDGTFLKGTINYFPIKMFETTPLVAEVNGIPVYFRYDFQTLQGLWIPFDILETSEAPEPSMAFSESFDRVYSQEESAKGNKSKFIVIGTALGAVITAVAFAIF